MFVALGIKNAMLMRCIILSSVICPDLPYFSTLSHKIQYFRGWGVGGWILKIIFFFFPTTCFWKFSHSEKSAASCHHYRFHWIWGLLTEFTSTVFIAVTYIGPVIHVIIFWQSLVAYFKFLHPVYHLKFFKWNSRLFTSNASYKPQKEATGIFFQ